MLIAQKYEPHVDSGKAGTIHSFSKAFHCGSFVNACGIGGSLASSQRIDDEDRVLSVERLVLHLSVYLFSHLRNLGCLVIVIPYRSVNETKGVIVNGLFVSPGNWYQNIK